MKRLVMASVLLLLTLGLVKGQVLSVSVRGGVGFVGKPSSFNVILNASEVRLHVPVDAVLVIDTSGSMNRWSNVIAGGPYDYVNITSAWTYVGSFRLNSPSDVELSLQTPNDIYTSADVYKARLSSGVGGRWGAYMARSSWADPAIVRWYDLQPGTYYIYARLWRGGMGRSAVTETRIMMVELPPTRIEVAKEAAKAFVGLMKYGDRVGLVNFSGNATILLNLTSDKALLNETIDGIQAATTLTPYHGRGMWRMRGRWSSSTASLNYSATNIAAGLKDAIKMLEKYGRRNSIKVIILLTDGWRNTGDDPVYWAQVAREKGYIVYTIGIGGADVNELKAIADAGGGCYYYARNGTELKEIYENIYRTVDCYAYNVTLRLKFYVNYVNSTPEGIVNGSTVTWHWNFLKNPVDVRIYVNSSRKGSFEVASGYVTYNDYWGFHKERIAVEMTFVGNFVVRIIPSRSNVTEYHPVNFTIIGNYPIKSVELSASPPIVNGVNSIVNVTYNGSKAIVSWTPLPNYVNRNESVNLTFNVTSVYGMRNVTGLGMYVINLPPVMLKAWTNRSSIFENEAVAIHVVSNYGITSMRISATPRIIPGVNSIILERVNGRNATIIWKPLTSYTDRNVTAVINVSITCWPYGSNSTSVSVKVYNVKTLKLITPHYVSGQEGKIIFIPITVIPPPELLNFTIVNSTVPMGHLFNSSVMSFVQINETNWMFAIAPQYNLTSNNSVENITIIWFAKRGNMYATNYTIVSIRDNSTVNRLPHPLVSNAMRLTEITVRLGVNTSKPVYIGEPIPVKVLLVNSTGGWVRVNEIKIWKKTGLPGPNVSVSTVFVPNVAGGYIIRAYATNGTVTVPSDVIWFVARIKPVTPS